MQRARINIKKWLVLFLALVSLLCLLPISAANWSQTTTFSNLIGRQRRQFSGHPLVVSVPPHQMHPDERQAYALMAQQALLQRNISLGVQPTLEDQGEWSEWGAASNCSRTCGGGTASQTRICLQVGYVVKYVMLIFQLKFICVKQHLQGTLQTLLLLQRTGTCPIPHTNFLLKSL